MARTSMPKLQGSSSVLTGGLVAAAAASAGVSLGLPFAAPPRDTAVRCTPQLRGEGSSSGAGSTRPSEDSSDRTKQAWLDSAIGTLQLGFGTCLVLMGSGVLHRARKSAVVRRAAGAQAAVAPSGSTSDEGVPGTPQFDVSSQPGVCAPYGEPGVSYWDPAGLATDIDSSTFRFYRKAELKHGRVCMLAVTGLIAQHEWRFNLAYPYETPAYDFSSVPSGIGAMMPGTPTSPLLGLFVLAAGLIELRTSDDGRDPGDFGDPAGFAASYGLDFAGADDKKQWQDFELNHCRLAMVGFLGAILGEYASGLDAVDQWWRAGAAFRRTFAIVFPQGDVPALESFF